MKNLKTATKDRGEDDVVYDPDALTQAVRVDGELQHIPVGNSTYRLGKDVSGDLDLTDGITETDLADERSGVGQEMVKANIGESAPYHNEVALAARSGVSRQIHRDGHSIHISQAIDEIENRYSSSLLIGWESDQEFVDTVADILVD